MRAVLGALVLAVLVGSTAPSSASPDRADGVWPLVPDPEVVRGFEPPPHPFAAGHRGVDLAGRPGQAVRAALPGTVGFAGSIGGKPVVTVLHGGRRTTYEPVVASVCAAGGGWTVVRELRTWPQRDDCDGFYAAVLTRAG